MAFIVIFFVFEIAPILTLIVCFTDCIYNFIKAFKEDKKTSFIIKGIVTLSVSASYIVYPLLFFKSYTNGIPDAVDLFISILAILSPIIISIILTFKIVGILKSNKYNTDPKAKTLLVLYSIFDIFMLFVMICMFIF